MKFVNPLNFAAKDLPLICLVDNRRGFLSWLIKQHTSGNYNHIQELHRPGFFVSQQLTGFREVPLHKYMKSNILLKFYRPIGLSDEDISEWLHDIDKELKAPWYKKLYDFPGLLGQLIPGRWTRRFNITWIKYCSERVASRLRKILKIVVPLHPNPSELNTILKKSSKVELLGYWFSD